VSFYALIPAAGTGSRLGAAAPKQYLPLAGRPMLWHAVRAVCVPPVETVFVVLARDDREFAAQDWSAFAGRLEPLYCGGESRRDSVYNGLVAAMADLETDDWVLVHDAARPCVRRADVDALIDATRDHPVGGILALPARDTLKRAGADNDIVETVDRHGLWHALTPQLFRLGELVDALEAAIAAGRIVTDEAQAMEFAGKRPLLVRGHSDNIKITHPDDLALADLFLGQQEKSP
jgi:2-C-methyl-D-erythritol 4-phosphate cytidylyltransferase